MTRIFKPTVFLFVFTFHCFCQKTYYDSTCHFSVVLPAKWSIAKMEAPFAPTNCAFGLKYPEWDVVSANKELDVSSEPICISVYQGSFEEDDGQLGIIYEDSSWWIEGRGGYRNEGTFLKSSFWNAIMGESEVGTYRRGGGYVGSASAYVAFLDNRKGKLIEIVADSFFTDKDTFDRIVNSIRF